MIYIVLNAIPILLAAVAGLGVGALYHVLSAGRVVSTAPPMAANPVPLLATVFVAEAWLASILAGALILAPPEAGEWTMAIGSAVVIWIGFVVPVLAVTAVYRATPLGAATLDAMHWLAVMLVQAAVLQTIGLTPPPV
ncbi:MAG: hypothetical protein H7Y08_06220 [Rhizobiaceae bacterium]|nr:hypothetical protein [Rhizobiaceae bacterium]